MEINIEETLKKVDELKKGIAEGDFVLKQLKAELEKQEFILQAFLQKEGLDSAEYGFYSFGWKNVKRKAFDQSLFAKKHPELLEAFKIEKTTKKFEIKIIK